MVLGASVWWGCLCSRQSMENLTIKMKNLELFTSLNSPYNQNKYVFFFKRHNLPLHLHFAPGRGNKVLFQPTLLRAEKLQARRQILWQSQQLISDVWQDFLLCCAVRMHQSYFFTAVYDKFSSLRFRLMYI